MPGSTEGPSGAQPAYHLLLAPEEVPVLRTALDLLVEDARDHQIIALARAVLARLPSAGELQRRSLGGAGADAEEPDWTTSIALDPGELKISHTAVHLLLDDLQREQADEVQILQRILEKLPDEHAIRAIILD